MAVVDASVLFEVVADTPKRPRIEARLRQEESHAAPHLLDAEVLGTIQKHHRQGKLDATASLQAVSDLRDWPGDRWPHEPFLERAWELRDNVRAYDGLYIALAEALNATLLTFDRRLSRAPGIRCRIEVL